LASIRVSCEPDSNVNDQSELQSETGICPRNSTDAGRQIDFNDEQPKSVFGSIRVSFEPDANENDESELQ
jgi:hypothetical protein